MFGLFKKKVIDDEKCYSCKYVKPSNSQYHWRCSKMKCGINSYGYCEKYSMSAKWIADIEKEKEEDRLKELYNYRGCK